MTGIFDHLFNHDNTDLLVYFALIISLFGISELYINKKYDVRVFKWWAFIPSVAIMISTVFGAVWAEKQSEVYCRSLLKPMISFFSHEFMELNHENIKPNTKTNNPDYIKLIELEEHVLNHIPDIQDIYTVTKNKDGNWVTLVDSDHQTKNLNDKTKMAFDQSSIGKVYQKFNQELNTVWYGNDYFTDNPQSNGKDQVITYLTPLKDKNNKVTAVLGINLSADKYISLMGIGRLFVIIPSSLLCLLLFIFATVSALITKERNKALESQNRLSAILNNSVDAHILIENEQITEVNQTALKLFDFKNINDFRSGAYIPLKYRNVNNLNINNFKDLEPSFGNEWAKYLEEALYLESSTFEWKMKKSTNQEFWALVTITPFVVLNEKKLLIIIKDISNEKEIEFELERQRLTTAESSKMATLGEMASGVAHEINNPLAVIKTNAEQISRAIQKGNPELDKIQERSIKISQTAVRISEIIKGLRAFARDGSKDQHTITSLKNTVEDTLVFCKQRFMSHNIPLEVDEIPNDLFFMGSSVQISQVLLNLINNAFDAVENTEKPWVKVTFETNKYEHKIFVTDSGKGISPELVNKIMYPFFTTKVVGKGTGLGLSISVGIINNHKGKLYVAQNHPNTRFVICLPRIEAKENPIAS